MIDQTKILFVGCGEPSIRDFAARLKEAGFLMLFSRPEDDPVKMFKANVVHCVLIDGRSHFDQNFPVFLKIQKQAQSPKTGIFLLVAHDTAQGLIEPFLKAEIDEVIHLGDSPEVVQHRINRWRSVQESLSELSVLKKERGEYQDSLAELHASKDEFISNVMHEIQTPIAIIREGINIILDGTAGPTSPEQQKFLDSANRNIDRLTAVIQDLMIVSKIDSGKLHMYYEDIDVARFIEKLIQSFMIFSQEKNVHLYSQVSQGVGTVKADAQRLWQAFTAFVGNALKYTPPKGEIEIGAKKDGWFITMWVRDTGPGISADTLKNIFEKFRFEDDVRKGMGLGLVVAKKVLEAQGGHVDVQSVKDYGTTVTVRLARKQNGEIYFYEKFMRSIEESVRNDSKFCVVDLVCVEWKALMHRYSDELLSDFVDLIYRIVKTHVTRPRDTIYNLGDGRIVLLLPRTEKSGGQIVKNRILEDLRRVLVIKAGGILCFEGHVSEYPHPSVFSRKDFALMSVLLVMKDENYIQLWSLVLKEKGVDLHFARCDEEAWAMIRANRYDLVILHSGVLTDKEGLLLDQLLLQPGFHARCVYLLDHPSAEEKALLLEKGCFRVCSQSVIVSEIETMLHEVYQSIKNSS